MKHALWGSLAARLTPKIQPGDEKELIELV